MEGNRASALNCMKYSEITKMGDEMLTKTLGEKRGALQKIAFAIAGSKGKNVRESRMIRKDIARILTKQSANKKVQ